MNAKTLFAAAALSLLGTAAMAQEIQHLDAPSSLTREQVRAELANYAGRPSMQVEVYGSDAQAVASVRDGLPLSANATHLARVDVRRQIASGANAATTTGESYGSVTPVSDPALSREAVREEAIAAMRHRAFGHAGD